MKQSLIHSLSCLAFLAQLSSAQDNSEIFSQYLGAPTVTPTYAGSEASYLSQSLTICTNYAHDLSPWPTAVIGTSGLAQHEQQLADGICQFCTSLSISRADSCCAVASSVACFDAFAAAGTPASNPATTTANGVVGSTATSKSHSGGDKVHMADLSGPMMAILGVLGWVL